MDLFENTFHNVEFETEALDESSQEIHERALARAKRYLLAEGELLQSIAEVDECRLYERFAHTHLTPYCVKVLGLSEEVAACFVRVVRKSKTVPALQRAVADGKVSLTKAKTIAAVITPKNQEVWIQKAATLSKDKLERAVAAENPLAKKPERAKPVGENRVRVEFEFTEEEMELFRRAQEVISPGKMATLAETARAALICLLEKKDPVRKAERRERNKTKDETSSPADAKHRCSRERRPRQIPAQVIHAVNLRDRGCCQAKLSSGEICGERKWVQLHHLRPLSEGGAHVAENLVTLCGTHHRQWHRQRVYKP